VQIKTIFEDKLTKNVFFDKISCIFGFNLYGMCLFLKKSGFQILKATFLIETMFL